MRNAQIEIADMVGQADALRQALELRIDELRSQQAELAEQLHAMQHKLTALELKRPEPVAPPAPKAPGAAAPKVEAIPEEIMLVIAAAVAAFVGKSARIRSARYLHEGESPWAQQGRVFVQASHNLLHHS